MTKRTKVIQSSIIAIALLLAPGYKAFAQAPSPEKIPVKIQIVISRYEGDRKVSSLPYTMLTIANGDRASFNIGANVPVLTQTTSSNGTPLPSISYTNTGTNIGATVTTEGGRFKINLNVTDNSLIDVKSTSPSATRTEPSTFRIFSYNTSIDMKEGETKQFISAADKVGGDVVKIDVTLTLDK